MTDVTTHYKHGSYNLEKVLDFSSCLEKSLILVKVLEKCLISSLPCLETFLCMSNMLLLFLDF